VFVFSAVATTPFFISVKERVAACFTPVMAVDTSLLIASKELCILCVPVLVVFCIFMRLVLVVFCMFMKPVLTASKLPRQVCAVISCIFLIGVHSAMILSGVTVGVTPKLGAGAGAGA